MGKLINYCMGKIMVVYMGNIDGTENQSGSTRHEEKRLHGFIDPRRSGNARYNGSVDEHQPERIDRKDRSQTNFNNKPGSSPDGGVVAQLIDEYRDQVELKKSTIKSLEIEIEGLDSRIQQLQLIQQQIESQFKV